MRLGSRPNSRAAIADVARRFLGSLRPKVGNCQAAAEYIVAPHLNLGVLGALRKPLADEGQEVDHAIERNLILDLEEITNQTSHTRPPGHIGLPERFMRGVCLTIRDSSRKHICGEPRITTVDNFNRCQQ